jgi:sigma-B regulation protein RsbU (phosphoserine phosphatase)
MLDARPSAPLGVRPATEYRRADAHLCDGDMLFAYTDGVTEAADAGGAMFGEARLERELREILNHRAAAYTGSVLGAVQRFAGEAVQSDDITMLALRLLPEA